MTRWQRRTRPSTRRREWRRRRRRRSWPTWPRSTTEDARRRLDRGSTSTPRRQLSKIVGRIDMPNVGDELHHFGWNACLLLFAQRAAPACRAALSGRAGPELLAHLHHRHQARSRNPQIVKIIEPDELAEAPATAGRTPCIAVPRGSMSRRSATPRARRRAAFS